MRVGFCFVAALLALVPIASAQAPGALKVEPNLVGQLDRPLRYRPDGTDFVIENGGEFFNRPLYGGNTAFRVDAGDVPEFTLYLPGRGGNLRFGLKSAAGAKWLHRAEHVVARYRPGSMLYEIRDPLLGRDGVLRLVAIALPMTEGLVVQLEAKDVAPDVELLWAYGGVNGQRGRRDGDIGTENVPIGQYFQLQPGFCADNVFLVSSSSNGFTLRAKPATILGFAPDGTTLAVVGAKEWDAPEKLFAPVTAMKDATPPNPIITGRSRLAATGPSYLVLQRIAETAATTGADLDTYREVTAPRAGENRPATAPKLSLLPAFHREDLPRVFAEAEAYFAALRSRVAVETPDPFINAAVASLNVAADAVWDEPQRAIMHGAIAWRTKLLGWRGPYLLDALGWHDRAREHFASWAAKQNTDPIPEKIPPADAASNLARNEAALHSNGDLSNSHYDMNLVYIDALFRHLRWTGDVEFARQMWPVIERHLAWERRLFRREFALGRGRPLYEAYAAIWASDDLGYGGAGTAHASAYNYFHNRMAAQVARRIGKDPTPYDEEANWILQAMRELLWTKDHFAESRDFLGKRLLHPAAGLWSIYHVIDSEVSGKEEASKMVSYVQRELPFLPVRGPGVPADQNYGVFSETNWLPYSWSINNVVMGENIHAALAFWQAGRAEAAFRLTKSSLLASMFMGITPGNVGSMNYLDVYRRESQRDFADGSGVLSRAIVEGLFGIQPDALAPRVNIIESEGGDLGGSRLKITPGFPRSWDRAKIHHPQVDFSYQRDGAVETFVIESRFSVPMRLRLEIPVRGKTAGVTVNGHDYRRHGDGGVSEGVITVTNDDASSVKVVVEWRGERNFRPSVPTEEWRSDNVATMLSLLSPIDWKKPASMGARFESVELSSAFNDRATAIFQKGKYLSPRSAGASLALPSQGLGAWAGHVNEMAEIDDRGLRAASAANGGRITLPNGVGFVTPSATDTKNVIFTSQWDNYPHEATVPLTGRAKHAYLLMAGSTNWMQSRIDNGEVVVTYTDGTTARLALENPSTWWPIEQDFFIDDYQFRNDAPLPPRVDLKTGTVRVLDAATFKGRGRHVDGGAATVLHLPLDPKRDLRSLTVRALANEVVIGLMAVTLERE